MVAPIELYGFMYVASLQRASQYCYGLPMLYTQSAADSIADGKKCIKELSLHLGELRLRLSTAVQALHPSHDRKILQI